MADNTQTVFRKKTLDRIASPEQLTDYLELIAAFRQQRLDMAG